jgi:hypothetical protein
MSPAALALYLLSLPLIEALAAGASVPSRRMADGKEWTSETQRAFSVRCVRP